MQSPLLVVVIMVKNEEKVIEKTLLPYVENGVKNICVFDTGSTDGTVEKTKSFFTQYGVDGFIDAEPFVDFATSRNRALEYAEKHFPHATFFLMIDANWHIHNIQRLIEFCEEHKTKTDPLYNIRIKLGKAETWPARLFRVSAENRYFGIVHEVPERATNLMVYRDVFFQVADDPDHCRKSRARYNRDIELLSAEYEKNPFNSRAVFYLAQTYECLGDIKNAYKYYLKRSVILNPSNPEENAITFFRLGYLAEHLCLIDDNFSWNDALKYYLKAFSMRKERIEPLLAIAEHYLSECPQISFVYLKYACSVPFPSKDVIAVQSYMYEFTRYNLLSGCAWVMGEIAVGKEAAEMALLAEPDNQSLQQRVNLYASELKRIESNPLEHMPIPKTLNVYETGVVL